MMERAAMDLAAVPVAEGCRCEPLSWVALKADDLGPFVQGDIGERVDALDEIARHGILKAVAAHHEMQKLYLWREKRHRLPRRVAAADECDLLAFAKFRFDIGRPIGHPGSLEIGKVWNVRPAVAHAGGDHNGLGPHRRSVIEFEHERMTGARGLAATIELSHFQRDGHLGAEF